MYVQDFVIKKWKSDPNLVRDSYSCLESLTYDSLLLEN